MIPLFPINLNMSPFQGVLMHRKPRSDLLPVDSELERTLISLRKVSRAEKTTMEDERID